MTSRIAYYEARIAENRGNWTAQYFTAMLALEKGNQK